MAWRYAPPYKTTTFVADDSGDPEPVTATIRCRRVKVEPVDGSSTFKSRGPLASSTAVTQFSGMALILERPSPGQYQQTDYGDPGFYEVGDIIAYIETPSGIGAKTFQMQEFA